MLARIVQPEGNLTGESLREAAYPLATARGSSFPAWRQLLFLGLPFLQLSGHQGWATEAAPLLGAGVTAVPPGEAAEARSDWLAAAVGMHRGLKAAAGAAVDTPPLLGEGEAAVLSGGSAEARGELRAAAVEVLNVLGDASAAADESPPLLGEGEAAVLSGGSAEARGGLRAAAVEVRNVLGDASAAAGESPPLLGAGEAAVEVRDVLGDASVAAEESPPLLGAGLEATDVVLQTADPTRGFTDASSWTSSSHVSQRTPDARRMWPTFALRSVSAIGARCGRGLAPPAMTLGSKRLWSYYLSPMCNPLHVADRSSV